MIQELRHQKTADGGLNDDVLVMYIKGMLKSHKIMDVNRIHEMLRLIVTGDDEGRRYSLSLDALEKFLNGLITAGILDFVNGSYALPSSDS